MDPLETGRTEAADTISRRTPLAIAQLSGDVNCESTWHLDGRKAGAREDCGS